MQYKALMDAVIRYVKAMGLVPGVYRLRQRCFNSMGKGLVAGAIGNNAIASVGGVVNNIVVTQLNLKNQKLSIEKWTLERKWKKRINRAMGASDMNLKFFMTYYVMFPLIILWLVKSFILKKSLNKKEMMINMYAPSKLFLFTNILFIFALIYSIYENIYPLENMKTSFNLLSGAFILWFLVVIYARCKFFKIHNQKRDIYIEAFLFLILVLIIYT